jgi:flagellar biosynthesis/type III secretory pathway M-ring protein FliF/YscJ
MPATTPYTTIISVLVVVIVVLLLLLGVCTVLQIANLLRAKASRREGREGTEHQEIHTKDNEAYGHFSGGGAAEAIGLTERLAGADVEYEEIRTL